MMGQHREWVDCVFCVTATYFLPDQATNLEYIEEHQLFDQPWEDSTTDIPALQDRHGNRFVMSDVEGKSFDTMIQKPFWAFKVDHSCEGAAHVGYCCSTMLHVEQTSWQDAFQDDVARLVEHAGKLLDNFVARGVSTSSVRFLCVVKAWQSEHLMADGGTDHDAGVQIDRIFSMAELSVGLDKNVSQADRPC